MAMQNTTIDAVFFDFSGVLAEEGFVRGLMEIGRRNHLDPAGFLRLATDICFNDGYATGAADEASFWQGVRTASGVAESDAAMRHAVLSRFVVRPWMLQVVDRVRGAGPATALLSDHTNWLEELDAVHGIYRHFDRVFNSYRERMTKRSSAFFTYACETMGVAPERSLFIDDNPGNTRRAHEQGMHVITYTTYAECAEGLRRYVPGLVLPPEGEVS